MCIRDRSRPEPKQVSDLSRVATKVSAIPGVSWLSRPSAPLGTVGVNNLPTVVMSFKHESNALSTWPPRHLNGYGDIAFNGFNGLMFFSNGDRPPSWICWVHFGTMHEGISRSLSL